jgi:hypothetical protein
VAVGIRVDEAFVILQVVIVLNVELFLVVEEKERVFSIFLGIAFAPVDDD